MSKGGQPGQSDDSMGIVWIIAAILIFSSIIWYVYKVQLIGFYFKLKLWEISFLSLFTHQLDDVRTVILSAPAANFTFKDVTKIGTAVGNYVRIPLVLLVFGLAFLIYFTNSTRVFKRIYTMKDLVTLEKDNWPQITPVVALDLVKTDIDKGPWAMALTPMQFCKRHQLLQEHKAQPREGMTRKEWGRIEVSLKRSEANRLFAIQLGPLWQGTAKLPAHVRALFAAFAARYASDSNAAAELLGQISRSSATKLNFAGADELLKKHEGNKKMQEIMQNHAYVLTVMASMLEAAREDGVQASADFLWLKPVDRRLWYMLNTVGRQTPFVEVAGPFAHWVAEKEIGRHLLVPMVEEATNALELCLKETVYRPDDPD